MWQALVSLWLLVPMVADTPPIQELTARVVGTHDGDTITVRTAMATLKVRLEGIDAPELAQAFGRVSRREFSKLVSGREVRLLWRERDRSSVPSLLYAVVVDACLDSINGFLQSPPDTFSGPCNHEASESGRAKRRRGFASR